MNQSQGITYILTSAFFFGTYGIWSRLMADYFGEFSQAWSRGLLLLIFVLIVNLKFRLFRPIARGDLKWFLAIALCGGLNQAPYFFGFEHLNIGTATILFYAALVVGGYLIGKLFFNETFTPVKILSLVLAFTGMLAIYGFTLSPDQYLAATLTVMAGLMGATAAVLPKKLSANYPEFQIMAGYFSVMLVANGVLAYLFHQPLPSLAHTTAWLSWLAYAIALILANYTVIEGFKYLDASIGSLIGLAEILFGLLFGIILFSESLTTGIIIGALFILASAALPQFRFLDRQP